MIMSVIVVFVISFGYVFTSRPNNAHDQSDWNMVGMPSWKFGACASYCGNNVGSALDIIIICGCGWVRIVVVDVCRGCWVWNGNGLEVGEDFCHVLECFCFSYDCFWKGKSRG